MFNPQGGARAQLSGSAPRLTENDVVAPKKQGKTALSVVAGVLAPNIYLRQRGYVIVCV